MCIDADVPAGMLGADADRSPMLAGVVVSSSAGDGSFDNADADNGALESTKATVNP